MRRSLAILLAALIGTFGCASEKLAEKQAFLEAGRQVKLRQPLPREGDLKKELGLFLEDDLAPTFEKAKTRERSEISTLRIVFVGGMAVVVLGATSGTLKDSPGWQAAVIGTGAAAMAYSALRYFGPVKDLRECQEFLVRQEASLRQWEARKLDGSDAQVSAETWGEYVNMVSQIQLHPSCLKVR